MAPNEFRRRKAEAFHRWTLSISGEIARRDDLKRFYIIRASQEVCPKHRKNHRETVGWYRKIARGVCSLLKWHGPGAIQVQNAQFIMHNPPGPIFSRMAIILA